MAWSVVERFWGRTVRHMPRRKKGEDWRAYSARVLEWSGAILQGREDQEIFRSVVFPADPSISLELAGLLGLLAQLCFARKNTCYPIELSHNFVAALLRLSGRRARGLAAKALAQLVAGGYLRRVRVAAGRRGAYYVPLIFPGQQLPQELEAEVSAGPVEVRAQNDFAICSDGGLGPGGGAGDGGGLPLAKAEARAAVAQARELVSRTGKSLLEAMGEVFRRSRPALKVESEPKGERPEPSRRQRFAVGSTFEAAGPERLADYQLEAQLWEGLQTG